MSVHFVIPASVLALTENSGDLLSRSLLEIAADLRAKRVTARELVETAIARHERFAERLHAYSLWAPEQARVVAQAADLELRRGAVAR